MNIPGGVGLPGGVGAPGGAGGASSQGYDPNDPNVKRLNALMESCFAKTAMAGVAGFGLGALFGMFMASMSYDTPFHTPGPTATTSTTAPTLPSSAATAAVAKQATTTAAAAVAKQAPTATAAVAKQAPQLSTPLATASATGALAASQLSSPAAPLASLPLRQQVALGFRDMGARSYSTAKNFAAVGALFSGIECGIEGLRARNDMANGVAAGCLTGAILARNAGPQGAAIGCAGFAAFSAAIDAWLRQPKDE